MENNSENSQIEHSKKMFQYLERQKKMGLAYLLWFLLGLTGAHRFYLNSEPMGLVQLISLLTAIISSAVAKSNSNAATVSAIAFFILAISVIIDIFLIPNLKRKANFKIKIDLNLNPTLTFS